MDKTTPQDKAKNAPDWERIELDYRAGIKTLRQIAGEHGISEGAIRKRAKRDDWTRDLSERIHDKAEQLVRKEAVRSTVRTESTISERVLVDANAQAVADIRLAHRKDIHRARRLTNALLDELEQQTDPETLVLLKEMGEVMRAPDDKKPDHLARIQEALFQLQAAICAATGGRADVLAIAIETELAGRYQFDRSIISSRSFQMSELGPAFAKVGGALKMTELQGVHLEFFSRPGPANTMMRTRNGQYYVHQAVQCSDGKWRERL